MLMDSEWRLHITALFFLTVTAQKEIIVITEGT